MRNHRFMVLLMSGILLLTVAGCNSEPTPSDGTTTGTTAMTTIATTTTTTITTTTTTRVADIDQQGAPVSVTPVPMVFTQQLPDWESIPYTISYNEDIGDGGDYTQHVAVVTTYEELQDMYTADNSANKERYDYTMGYTESFFEDNALIAVFDMDITISNSVTVTEVLKKDNRICLVKRREDVSDDGMVAWEEAYYRIFVTVPKDALQGVDEVLVYGYSA